jgi:hypothetical protein
MSPVKMLMLPDSFYIGFFLYKEINIQVFLMYFFIKKIVIISQKNLCIYLIKKIKNNALKPDHIYYNAMGYLL